ncbi:VCBS repeat-containing protein [Nonomuraea sp. SMC257]|uniref:VCBS repeat-containing protein n=1 Tax=Nonomuraea montanisoli TaxID=2741721 RepID=A0A7Y6IBP7_9ACTN|nr:FG-GAP-like repeat-containing protein [Nonomuraea montanisoli]NUW33969.1 VCBS repeat-containing protein [Nonomuraea montanisoli]
MTTSFTHALRRAFTRTLALSAAALLAVCGSAPAPAAASADARQGVLAAGRAPMLPLFVRRSSDGHLLAYEPKAGGGLEAAVDLGGGFAAATALLRATTSEGGARNDLFLRLGGELWYTAERGASTMPVASAMDVHNLIMTPGDMGSSAAADIIARDTAGALWLYPGRADGGLAARVQAGTAGWNGMNALAGYGDYTGDGKNDLLARTTAGALYIYPGTGAVTAGQVLGARVSAGTGWETYTALVSTGDNDGDGRADLIARDPAGALWLFKGTGVASAPFAAREKIGNAGWNAFNAFF